MAKRDIVRLTDAVRGQLEQLVSTGRAAAYKIQHARIPMKANADGPAWLAARNASGTGVDRQFTTDDARIRLRRLYPQS